MKIIALIILAWLLPSCNPGISEFSHSVDAEYTLKNYLDYRDKRKFQKCCDYYTAGFKKRFIRSFGNTCPDWFRESEMDFKESRIVGSKRGNLNRFTVESTIDDPTANGKSITGQSNINKHDNPNRTKPVEQTA
jgi:hypothetical protein